MSRKYKIKWTEYVAEFFLVFFAVILGFLADSYREGLNEKSIEIQYMKSMIEDLRRDTANFDFFYSKAQEAASNIDSLINELELKDISNNSLAYYHARNVTRNAFPYEIFDRTYTEMKTSGNLRILRYPDISDSISSYYSSLQLLYSQQNFITNFLQDYIRLMPRVFDMTIMHKIYIESGFTVSGNNEGVRQLMPLQKIKDNPPLASINTSDINTLVSNLHYLYARLLRTNSIIKAQKSKGKRLIQLLKEKYNIT